MITKNSLLRALNGIQERKLSYIGYIKHLESWAGIYTIEVHRTNKHKCSCEDFILSSFLKADEECFCEDDSELEELVNECVFEKIMDNIPSRVNSRSKNRVSFLFDEVSEVLDATELFNDWNRYYVLMETEDEYLSLFVSIPE